MTLAFALKWSLALILIVLAFAMLDARHWPASIVFILLGMVALFHALKIGVGL